MTSVQLRDGQVAIKLTGIEKLDSVVENLDD